MGRKSETRALQTEECITTMSNQIVEREKNTHLPTLKEISYEERENFIGNKTNYSSREYFNDQY